MTSVVLALLSVVVMSVSSWIAGYTRAKVQSIRREIKFIEIIDSEYKIGSFTDEQMLLLLNIRREIMDGSNKGSSV